MDNYDKYNKYPIEVLQEALRTNGVYAFHRDEYEGFLRNLEKVSKEIAEEKIKKDKRIAEEEKKVEEKAKEDARLSKKYNKPWCYPDKPWCYPDKLWIFAPQSAPYKNCLLHLYWDEEFVVVQQTHNGTLVGRPRLRTHHHHHYHVSPYTATVGFIERNSLDSSLPLGSYVPAGIFEFTGRYQNAETKVKRLE